VAKEGDLSRSPHVNTNYYWHSDRANFPNGSAMVLLHGQVLPPTGGDTQICNLIVYTHKWRKGDFIIWDNLCLMHRALRNYEMDSQLRVMLRCGIRSTRPIQ